MSVRVQLPPSEDETLCGDEIVARGYIAPPLYFEPPVTRPQPFRVLLDGYVAIFRGDGALQYLRPRHGRCESVAFVAWFESSPSYDGPPDFSAYCTGGLNPGNLEWVAIRLQNDLRQHRWGRLGRWHVYTCDRNGSMKVVY